jgi:hypothetical protein
MIRVILMALFFVPGFLNAGSLPAFSDYFKISTLGKVQSRESAHFRVEWVHPRDETFVNALLEYLEAAHQDLDPLFRVVTSGGKKVPVEIYPDLKSFSEVSGLSLARFKASGTIALTLEQRLMLLSPRNLYSGYTWATTAVHELIHYLINSISPSRVPIWLHEGTAQVYQGYPYQKTASLQPSQWGLFKKYRAKRGLLSLETLKEPFPYRKDPEETELAYVQALLFVKWLDQQCGAVSLIRLTRELPSIEQALERCTGMTYSDLSKKFIPQIMAKIEIPGGSDVAYFARDFSGNDPRDAESKRADQDSQNFAQLSSRLFDQGRYRASAVEMQQALQKTPVTPPSWRRQLAMALEKSGQPKESGAILSDLLKDYPDDAGAWFLKGRQALLRADMKLAWDAFLRAFYVNPFMEGLDQEMGALKQQHPHFGYSFLKADPQK